MKSHDLRIAVIGSGIAGHGAAYRLTRALGPGAVSVLEKEPRPGGHAATVDIDYDGTPITVDTGFIVYNTLNYPLMTALFSELGVETQASDMGFALSLDKGAFEWSGQDKNPISALFAQRSNILSPRFWRMLTDILRFNRQAITDLETGALHGLTLGDYVAKLSLSARFRDDYILPMGAAIWSMSAAEMLNFPAQSFVAFFNNHRLLHAKRPVWRTVTGGSRNYVAKLVKASGHESLLGDGVTHVARHGGKVEITRASGARDMFDAVILATHADTSLALLTDADGAERAMLGAMRYADNDVYLHRDARLMPRRKAAWAAWNVLRHPGHDDAPVTVSYWMNRLQGINEAFPLFITLNPPEPPPPSLTFGRYSYAHPQYDISALAAQQALPGLQGRGGVYFAGAWAGYGFHEDGLRAGFEAADLMLADIAASGRLSG